jgi:DNA-binding transcriptional regulator YdaS (Cro superfamily)
MSLKDLPNKELKEIAARIGTSYGYLAQLKYAGKKPSAQMARRIEEATQGRVTRLELLYPEEFARV